MTLETIALWWCYLFGATAALALYAVFALWTMDKLAEMFRVKKAIVEWAWGRMSGYEMVKPEITTRKGGGKVDRQEA
jgi:hypothetical protein